MTTHAAMAIPRQPFSPLTSPRLQHLQSSKNRQSGALSSPVALDGKHKLSTPAKPSTLNPPTKRRFSPSDLDDEFDSENIDPSSFLSSTKRSKNNDSVPVKASSPSPAFNLISTPKFTFTAPKSTSSSSMPPPSAIPARLQTPTSRGRANISSPRAPLTAPAGRSPKSKRDVKNRRVSAPFTRIDPPSFSRNSASSSALPFSLDAALAGTLAKPSPPTPAVKTIQESMPKNWFFDIYEDSPEEEAANLMEHSTLTLDLSSDEESSKRDREDKGKENVAPSDYDLPSESTRSTTSSTASPSLRAGKKTITRRKIAKPDEMDDGERSPLSDLETEDFFAAGITRGDFVVVPPTPEKKARAFVDVSDDSTEKELCAINKASVRLDNTRTATTNTRTATTNTRTATTNTPADDGDGEVQAEILIWEDTTEVAADCA